MTDELTTLRARVAALESPVPILLFCPKCGLQHVDTATSDWDNPPHKSHLCLGCGYIWRVSDRPTVGVARIKTRGDADSAESPVLSDEVAQLVAWLKWIAGSLGRAREKSMASHVNDAAALIERLSRQIKTLKNQQPKGD